MQGDADDEGVAMASDETSARSGRDRADRGEPAAARGGDRAGREAGRGRNRGPVGPDDGPESPTELPGAGWKAALKRTVREFQEDSLTDWAAALTY